MLPVHHPGIPNELRLKWLRHLFYHIRRLTTLTWQCNVTVYAVYSPHRSTPASLRVHHSNHQCRVAYNCVRRLGLDSFLDQGGAQPYRRGTEAAGAGEQQVCSTIATLGSCTGLSEGTKTREEIATIFWGHQICISILCSSRGHSETSLQNSSSSRAPKHAALREEAEDIQAVLTHSVLSSFSSP